MVTIFQVALGAPESDLIPKLPGQTQNISFKQYSGYITTNKVNGRALFYYFVEAEKNPTSSPLTLWFNGGPGCSSVGFGAFMEHGPFKPISEGLLEQNKYSWNKESNMLYVESPVGVGFSYSNTTSDNTSNDTLSAQDNLDFLLNWLEKFPELKDVDIYLAGESFAGHYVPLLAALVVDHNKRPNITPIKLKAILLGNPLLDLEICVNNGEYLWSHGLISDSSYLMDQTVCNNSRYLNIYYQDDWTQACQDVSNNITADIGDAVDIHDVTLGACLSDIPTQAIPSRDHGKIHTMSLQKINDIDLCVGDKILAYLNNQEVQKALHANTTSLPYPWDFCFGPLFYQENNMANDIKPVLAKLLEGGLPIFLFSGDQDAVVPLTSTRTIVDNLAKELKLFKLLRYSPWYDQKQVAGWTQAYGTPINGKNQTLLTYATVRGASHTVPYTSPSEALALFRALLKGLPLPNK
ncbi:serine carboxypeptidase-like 45 [Cryptomeria japonica]|uniref:serine carboxypeptidase-like 45 n=1 Tax=Cryptomeria japonica TaxID=3369 RepID=UPI0027DA4116|nr:serine carboxypeptidase-like 45 [Cryptomeria japonica]